MACAWSRMKSGLGQDREITWPSAAQVPLHGRPDAARAERRDHVPPPMVMSRTSRAKRSMGYSRTAFMIALRATPSSVPA
jgi:hypothetical protein